MRPSSLVPAVQDLNLSGSQFLGAKPVCLCPLAGRFSARRGRRRGQSDAHSPLVHLEAQAAVAVVVRLMEELWVLLRIGQQALFEGRVVGVDLRYVVALVIEDLSYFSFFVKPVFI